MKYLSLASCLTIGISAPAAIAGYTVTREIQATLTVDGPSGTATASTSKGFVFNSRDMIFTDGPRNGNEAPISKGSAVGNFNAFASTVAGTESKLSLSVSTPDNTSATGNATSTANAGSGIITLPNFATQSLTAGGDGTGLSFNISPAGLITPPQDLKPGTAFTSKRSSSFSVF